MKRYKIINDLPTLGDNDLIARVKILIICLTGNTAFTALPVAITALQALLDAFQTAVNNMAVYNTPEYTALRDEARELLLDATRKTSAYVQSVALNSLSTMRSSGFDALEPGAPSVPLEPTAIVQLSNLASTQLLARLLAVDNAVAFELRLSTDGGKTWFSGGISRQARRIVLSNLTPGTVYDVSARGIGGSTGYSDWCPKVSLMCT